MSIFLCLLLRFWFYHWFQAIRLCTFMELSPYFLWFNFVYTFLLNLEMVQQLFLQVFFVPQSLLSYGTPIPYILPTWSSPMAHVALYIHLKQFFLSGFILDSFNSWVFKFTYLFFFLSFLIYQQIHCIFFFLSQALQFSSLKFKSGLSYIFHFSINFLNIVIQLQLFKCICLLILTYMSVPGWFWLIISLIIGHVFLLLLYAW